MLRWAARRGAPHRARVTVPLGTMTSRREREPCGGLAVHFGGFIREATMTPNFRQTGLTLDPVRWRAQAVLADEDVVVTVEFPFHPEYDMTFEHVRTLAERRAWQLLAEVRPPSYD